MNKKIVITGATDGIGLETAKHLAAAGHQLLLHGRSAEKLRAAEQAVRQFADNTQNTPIETYLADLSRPAEVSALARSITAQHDKIDVLINNAGVFKISEPMTADGLDSRFAVNCIAPYLLSRQLLPLLDSHGRIVNLSSAAQAPVDLQALNGQKTITDDFNAYAQSKLALTMWTHGLALSLAPTEKVIVAVNPGSMLGSKMVKEAFGITGGDIGIGADILMRAATSKEFAQASGQYFDNDAGHFSNPHPDAIDPEKCQQVITAIETVLTEIEN